jgi:hypothetical protein
MTTEEKDRDGEDRKSSKESGKKSDSDENDADDDSAAGLEPARPKTGESKDNLKKRADYFQKRHGGG